MNDIKKIKTREILKHFLDNCADLGSDEKILIISDEQTEDLALDLEKILKGYSEQIFTKIIKYEYTQLSAELIKTIKLFAKIICLKELPKGKLRELAYSLGIKFLIFPDLTEDIFPEAAFLHNFKSTYRLVNYFAAILTKGKQMQIWSGRDARLDININGSQAEALPGFINDKINFASPPAITVSIKPQLKNSYGVLTAAEITCYLEQGRIVDACSVKTGYEQDLNFLGYEADNYSLQEIGIGLNPYLSLSGNSLLDKSAWGCIYLQFSSQGRPSRENNYWEFILAEVTLIVDEVLYIFEGKILE